MKAIFNGRIHNWGDDAATFLNRGFKYADGLFETIAVTGGKPRLFPWHLERLTAGAGVLRLQAGDILDEARLLSEIQTLQKENGLTGDARLRLYLFRDSGGLFTPAGHDVSYMITIEPAEFVITDTVAVAGFSQDIRNYETPFSRFKTLNALKYVLAGIEKQENHWDEIILTDTAGHVSEALSSNIFWKIKDVWFTPPLSTGCVEGIMRRWVMKNMRLSDMEIREGLVTSQSLLEAKSIITTNSMGIRHILRIGDRRFEVDDNIRELAAGL